MMVYILGQPSPLVHHLDDSVVPPVDLVLHHLVVVDSAQQDQPLFDYFYLVVVVVDVQIIDDVQVVDPKQQ